MPLEPPCHPHRAAPLALAALPGRRRVAVPTTASAQVIVGASLPLTGPRALLGRYWQNGVNQALAEINAAGGVLGKPMQVVVEDDLGDNPNGATNAVNRLMKVHKVHAMLGPNWSVAQMATQKFYCDGSIVSVTGASGVPVTAAGCKYVVRIRANDILQGQALVTYAREHLKYERIGVIHVSDDYGKGGADRVVKAIEAQGLKPVGVESHNPEDKDFSAQLGRLQRAGAQLVIIWTHDQESALIVRQARQLGLPFKFAGSTAVSQPIFLKLAGEASEGVISPSDYVASNPDPLVQAFAKKYAEGYKTESELYAATYYDATHMLAKAINLAGSTDPVKLREAFPKVRHTGVLGSYRCVDNGDCNHQVHMVEIVKGQPLVKSTVKFLMDRLADGAAAQFPPPSPGPSATAPVVLDVATIDAFYGQAQILFGVSVQVARGEVVAVIGANGAGKSTVLNTVMGRLVPQAGAVTLEGRSIAGMATEAIIAAGVACVPQRRRIFPTLTVRENLEVGGYVRRGDKAGLTRTLDEVHTLFPVLHKKATMLGGVLSGGEQQMLAIGRGLMSNPRLLLLDEPSMGISPKLTTEMFRDIRRIADTGRTVMLVEQNAYAALAIANRGYVLENGRVALQGAASELIHDDYVRQTYLGA